MLQTVYAADAAGQQSAAGFSTLLFMGLFFIVFYFIGIRPKQKQQQQHRDLVNSLNKGDEVITYSGIMGQVSKVKGEYIVINIADNIEVKMQKNHISNILPKGTLKSI
jgi:preprotein translocase subunit YajC